MAKKTTTIWAIKTIGDEYGNMDTHGYFATRELAVQELPKYRDWYRCYPPEPDDKHIVPIEVITEL